MAATLGRRREAQSVDGHLQPINNGGFHLVQEKGDKFWFVVQNSTLLFYEQKGSHSSSVSKPFGSVDICSSTLKVFVVLTSKDNKEYLLTPSQGGCLADWLTNLQDKTSFGTEKPSDVTAALERGQQSSFMSRVRSSFRRKKKMARSVSQDSTSDQSTKSSPSPSKRIASPGKSPEFPSNSGITSMRKLDRSLTYPSESEDESRFDEFTLSLLEKEPSSKPEVKTFADKACDTMTLEWVMPELNVASEGPVPSAEPDGGVVNRLAQFTATQIAGSLHIPPNVMNIQGNEMEDISLRDSERDTLRDTGTLCDTYSTLRDNNHAGVLRDTSNGILRDTTNVTGLRDSNDVDHCESSVRDAGDGHVLRTESHDEKLRDLFEKSSAEVLEEILGQVENRENTRSENSKIPDDSGIFVEQSKEEEEGSRTLPDNTGQLKSRTEKSVTQSLRSSDEKLRDSRHSSLRRVQSTNTWGHTRLHPVKSNGISKVREIESLMEASTLQQQKIIRELEVEVCRLKCEVISLIQDDDLADWHYVEEIRYKDRIFELLREARLCNPKLPNFDSSKSGAFRDGYGFIHGSRESESVVFHYVCRELTQHYSSFYQNKNGHVQFFEQYINAKKQGDKKILYKERELKSLARDGIPGSCRREVWLSLIYEKVDSLKKNKGSQFYQRQVSKITKKMHALKSEMSDVERQIKCDLLRTMPSNEKFKTLDSDGVKSLSRVLHCFADYMPEIGYLQGMNFLVGLFLLFMEEEEAFWSLVAVVEFYLKGYFDHFLSGAQADQEVLKDLVSEMLPVLHSHFKYYGVDISTVTFNWLITVYLDAVPFETVLRIWDCFLFEGREALFRVAIGLLKLQQRSLLQLSGPLEIMQYMKRAARVTYDVDRLFKASFDEIVKFPTNDQLDEMQRKHIETIEKKYDFKTSVENQRKRSRVSSFTVEIPTPEKQEKLDQYQIVECAVATSNDLSSPVCILCSSRGAARIYLLDINKREMITLQSGVSRHALAFPQGYLQMAGKRLVISCRVLCAEVLEDGTLLVGTIAWFVHAFSLDFREELWSVPLRDSVIDLSHYYISEADNKVYAALADGSIAVLSNANATGPPTEGSHVRIGNAPVTCITILGPKVWCGCGNNVVVLDSSTLEELHSMVVSPIARHQVARLLVGDHGIWCNIRGSSWVALINPDTYEFLLKVDVSVPDTSVVETPCQSQVTVSHFQESRVTTVMVFNEELWVGLGNGQVMIFDVIENDRYEEESYVLLRQESRAESRGDDHQGGKDEDATDAGASAVKRSEPTRVRAPSNETVSSECRLTLQLRTFYRISEEAIRSLVLLRDNDPLVLSCAGTLSAEGGLSLWQEQPSGPETTEWLPCCIKHKFRQQRGSLPGSKSTTVIVDSA